MVLIIGGGPVGLRAAIECHMLGCKVLVVEKRTRITRNNVLLRILNNLERKSFMGNFVLEPSIMSVSDCVVLC